MGERDMRSTVSALPDDFLRCRDQGHTWKLASIGRWGRGYSRAYFCPSCKTNKTQHVGARGDVLSTSYDYADGYQLTGLGRMNVGGRDALRLEHIHRELSAG